MAKVFGVANHGPEHTITWLSTQPGHKSSKTSIIKVGELLTKKKTYGKDIVILSASDFFRNLPRINHKHFKAHNFFIHCSVLRLSEIDGIIPTDYSQDPVRKSHFNLSRVFNDLCLKQDPAKVELTDRKYLADLIYDIRESGFLDKLMTFIYTLPSATHQKPITFMVCDWLYNGCDEDEIDIMLNKLKSDIRIVDKLRNNVRKHLTSKVALNIQKAFAVVREKKEAEANPPSMDTLAKKYAVSAYDLRYIASKLRQKEAYANHERKNVDEFVKNRGVS